MKACPNEPKSNWDFFFKDFLLLRLLRSGISQITPLLRDWNYFSFLYSIYHKGSVQQACSLRRNENMAGPSLAIIEFVHHYKHNSFPSRVAFHYFTFQHQNLLLFFPFRSHWGLCSCCLHRFSRTDGCSGVLLQVQSSNIVSFSIAILCAGFPLSFVCWLNSLSCCCLPFCGVLLANLGFVVIPPRLSAYIYNFMPALATVLLFWPLQG